MQDFLGYMSQMAKKTAVSPRGTVTTQAPASAERREKDCAHLPGGLAARVAGHCEASINKQGLFREGHCMEFLAVFPQIIRMSSEQSGAIQDSPCYQAMCNRSR